MVKRFCQWLYEEWSENFIFVCQEEMVKGTYVRFEYKLRFMREVMVQYLQHRLLKWFDENQRIDLHGCRDDDDHSGNRRHGAEQVGHTLTMIGSMPAFCAICGISSIKL